MSDYPDEDDQDEDDEIPCVHGKPWDIPCDECAEDYDDWADEDEDA